MNNNESNDLRDIRKMLSDLHKLHFGIGPTHPGVDKKSEMIANILLRDVKKKK